MRRRREHLKLFAPCNEGIVERALAKVSLEEGLPALSWEVFEQERLLELVFVSQASSTTAKFVYELLSRYLVPGRRLNLPLFFSCEIASKGWTLIRAAVELESDQQLQAVLKRLEFFEFELTLGATSYFHARCILEAKGVTLDEKAALVHERMLRWICRFPASFDAELLFAMHALFILAKEGFKQGRSAGCLARIVISFYALKKELVSSVEKGPSERHFKIRCAPFTAPSPLGAKKVLGLFVGLNFLKKNEVFEERHLMEAVRSLYPELSMIAGSVYKEQLEEERVQILYVELAPPLAPQDLGAFKKRLPEEIKKRVERLVSPVFMPRNEEEVLRSIVTLAGELKFVADVPQVMLHFDHQTDEELYFTLVMASLQEGLAERLSQSSSLVTWRVERAKEVGKLRNRYPKIASVLSAHFKKAPFLREDRSLNLYLARQKVIDELQSAIGQIRDYNGGMLAKQVENLSALSEALGPLAGKEQFLLSNFFHSLYPVEVRALLLPEVMKGLFMLLLSVKEEEGALGNRIAIQEERGCLLALFALQDPKLHDPVHRAIDALELKWPYLATLHLPLFETLYIGALLFSEDLSLRERFTQSLQSALQPY